MFNIKEVTVLPSKTGNGLQINDLIIGCAQIVDVEVEENATLEGCMKEGLLSAGMILRETEDGNQELQFVTDSLKNSFNYVLVSIKDSECSIINNASEFGEIFGLPEDDIEMLGQYIGALAEDRNLVMNIVNDTMVFTNNFHMALTYDHFHGNDKDATVKFIRAYERPEFRAEISSHNFIKMFLIALITAAQDRYNKVNREETLYKVAKELTNIKYWDDGKLLNPSIADVEEFLDKIKSIIRVAD